MVQSRTSRLTFLDTSLSGGRPVIILKKTNVVPEHNVMLTVTYDFDKMALFYVRPPTLRSATSVVAATSELTSCVSLSLSLQEPMYLVAAFAVFYLICMVAVRVDLRITVGKEGKTLGSSKEKVA